MKKTTLTILIAALAGFLLQGCSSLLVKSTPAPVYFQLDYQPVTVDCPRSFNQAVRIAQFGVSSPYDRRSMMVIKGQRASYSSEYEWVASPGKLVADSLLRDMSLGMLFTQAAGPNSPAPTPLELTGHIFTFAWEQGGTGYQARLHAELSLIDTSSERNVILRKNYRLTSGTSGSNTPDNFAKAMASVMAQFSKQLQEDLCEVRNKN